MGFVSIICVYISACYFCVDIYIKTPLICKFSDDKKKSSKIKKQLFSLYMLSF